MPTSETRKKSKRLKLIIQGHGRGLELAFVRDGRVFAYVLPADERSQECFDALYEVYQAWNGTKRGTKR